LATVPGNTVEADGLLNTIPPLKSEENEHEIREPVIDLFTTLVHEVPDPG